MSELSHPHAETTGRPWSRSRPHVPEWLELLLRNRMSAFGIALLAVIVLVTALAPLLTSQDPSIPNVVARTGAVTRRTRWGRPTRATASTRR